MNSVLTVDLLSTISDPEHPLTLSQLAVVQLPHITVKDDPSSPMSSVLVEITPTIPHCSMATLIGLCIRVRLERALPQRFKVDIKVVPGTHQSENQVVYKPNQK
jgi:metal-sulfur cluster biosynthetic enzyme